MACAVTVVGLAGVVGGCEPREAAAEAVALTNSANAPNSAQTSAGAGQGAAEPVAPLVVARAAVPAPPPPRPRLGFIGDLAMTLLVGHYLDEVGRGRKVPPQVVPGFPFQDVADHLRALDLVVGNLECVLSDRGQRATDHNPFRCSLRTPEVLRDAGIDLVSVANNHALDYGKAGFDDTVRRLERSGMPFIGHETMLGRASSALVRVVGGRRIALLGYTMPGPAALVDVSRAHAAADLVVVFNHWGGENVAAPTPGQRSIGRQLVDAGADLVVGTHAHVLQPLEWYRGRLIAYGLGNFVFDAMFDSEAHRVGALLELELDVRPDRAPDAPPYGCSLARTRLDEHGVPHWQGEREPCDAGR